MYFLTSDISQKSHTECQLNTATKHPSTQICLDRKYTPEYQRSTLKLKRTKQNSMPSESCLESGTGGEPSKKERRNHSPYIGNPTKLPSYASAGEELFENEEDLKSYISGD